MCNIHNKINFILWFLTQFLPIENRDHWPVNPHHSDIIIIYYTSHRHNDINYKIIDQTFNTQFDRDNIPLYYKLTLSCDSCQCLHMNNLFKKLKVKFVLAWHSQAETWGDSSQADDWNLVAKYQVKRHYYDMLWQENNKLHAYVKAMLWVILFTNLKVYVWSCEPIFYPVSLIILKTSRSLLCTA